MNEKMDLEKSKVESKTKPVYTQQEPPDGGWGWVIVFGGGIALSLAMGFNKSVALVYQALLVRFKQSAAATAWVTSLTGMIRMMSSPFVSSLCNRFSHRNVAIAAGFITSASYILSAFPPNLPYLYVTLGLMQGIGVNMFIVPSLSMVAIYFDKNKGKAMSMITSSFGFGALYMAPVLRLLFSEYGYTGTFLILGALVLHFTAAGLLFRPLRLTRTVTVIGVESPSDFSSTADKCNLKGIEGIGSSHSIPKKIQHMQQEKPLLQDSKGMQGEVSVTTSIKSINKSGINSARSITSSNSNTNRTFGAKMRRTLRNGSMAIVKELGLHMLADTQFLLLGFTMSSIAWTMTNSWTLAAGLAKEKNFTSSEVTLLLVVVAASELPCRLTSGFLFDIGLLKRHRTFGFSLFALVVGVANTSLPLIKGVIPTFIVWSIMMGLLGSCNSQYPTVISDLVSRSDVTSGLGLIRLLQGIGAFLGPVMGGLFRDYTGTYAYGFYAGGVQLVIFSTLLAIRSRCGSRCIRSKNQENV